MEAKGMLLERGVRPILEEGMLTKKAEQEGDSGAFDDVRRAEGRSRESRRKGRRQYGYAIARRNPLLSGGSEDMSLGAG